MTMVRSEQLQEKKLLHIGYFCTCGTDTIHIRWEILNTAMPQMIQSQKQKITQIRLSRRSSKMIDKLRRAGKYRKAPENAQ